MRNFIYHDTGIMRLLLITLFLTLSTSLSAQNTIVYGSIGKLFTAYEDYNTANTFGLSVNRKLSKMLYVDLTVSGFNVGSNGSFENTTLFVNSNEEYRQTINSIETLSEFSITTSVLANLINTKLLAIQYGIGLSFSKVQSVDVVGSTYNVDFDPQDDSYKYISIESTNRNVLNPKAIIRIVPNTNKVYWSIDARYGQIDVQKTDASINFNFNIGFCFD